jgi:hypothetical protein
MLLRMVIILRFQPNLFACVGRNRASARRTSVYSPAGQRDNGSCLPLQSIAGHRWNSQSNLVLLPSPESRNLPKVRQMRPPDLHQVQHSGTGRHALPRVRFAEVVASVPCQRRKAGPHDFPCASHWNCRSGNYRHGPVFRLPPRSRIRSSDCRSGPASKRSKAGRLNRVHRDRQHRRRRRDRPRRAFHDAVQRGQSLRCAAAAWNQRRPAAELADVVFVAACGNRASDLGLLHPATVFLASSSTFVPVELLSME